MLRPEDGCAACIRRFFIVQNEKVMTVRFSNDRMLHKKSNKFEYGGFNDKTNYNIIYDDVC